ncbi:hypothetical protein HNR42_001491 [Deinobacterium chartae]|uniref:Death domain-containing protein n=1 Tax=Deinobacterium chartae TaxID=521158 RepID=A0A841I1A8_9DEIO|nr:hypothetical protein [Deinobacterium chartae]MBB6098068.1 hypothetical protein [Deinobacterium chartae]
MNWLRPVTALIVGCATALVLFGAFYNRFSPRPEQGDPQLALQMIPVELLGGLLIGVLVYRVFGRKLADPTGSREDVHERMLMRFAFRRGGVVQLDRIENESPLDRMTARQLLHRWVQQGRAEETAPGEFRVLR